jgi:hypothetical protein
MTMPLSSEAKAAKAAERTARGLAGRSGRDWRRNHHDPRRYGCEVIVTRQGRVSSPEIYRGNWTPSLVRAVLRAKGVEGVELVRVLTRDEYLDMLPE